MKNPEMGGVSPEPNKEGGRRFVGAQKNPDGTWDYSHAMSVESSKENSEEFQKYVQKILNHLDKLDELLDSATFKPGWPQLGTLLNQNITGITAFKRVLEKVSQEEYDAIVQKANIVEKNMKLALAFCEAEKTKRDEGEDGTTYVDNATFAFLRDEGPAVLEALHKLEDIKA